MDINDAVDIIEGIIQSLKDNPKQFNISIHIAGQKITSYGGTGLSIIATGGESGSNTIGQVISANGADIQISQERGMKVMDDKFNALLQTLNKISIELQSSSPDKGIIKQLYNSLTNTWVPGIIVSVISKLLTKAIGL